MRPLSKKDLVPARALTPAYFRATHPYCGRREFRRIYEGALTGSTYRFVLDFADAWRIDLLDLRKRRRLGRPGPGLGDAHPARFAFCRDAEGPRYGYDGLPASEPAWPSLEAVRFFACASLLDLASDETDELIWTYVAITYDRDHPRPLPLHLRPDLAAVSREVRLRWTDGSRLRTNGSQFQVVPESAADDRLGFLHRLARERGGRVAEIAVRVREDDAVRPLEAVVRVEQRDGAMDLWSVEEIAVPAGPARAPSPHRVDVIEAAGLVPVRVRGLLDRAEIDLESASANDRRAVLTAQVSILGSRHRGSYAAEEAAVVQPWLKASARFLRRRYAAVHDRLRD